MMLYLNPAEAIHAQRNARMPCACTVHYPVVTTSGLTLDERSRLLMVNGSLYLHEWDGAAVLARHFEAQAPLAQKETSMSKVLIDSNELANLRRRAVAPKASASKPNPKPNPKTKPKVSAKPRTDPQRQRSWLASRQRR